MEFMSRTYTHTRARAHTYVFDFIHVCDTLHPLAAQHIFELQKSFCYHFVCRSQWQRGLRRRSTTVRLLGSWVRIPPGAWTFVCCERCVLSGRGLCDELAPRPGKSYRLWCVIVCKIQNLMNEEPE